MAASPIDSSPRESWLYAHVAAIDRREIFHAETSFCCAFAIIYVRVIIIVNININTKSLITRILWALSVHSSRSTLSAHDTLVKCLSL